MCRVIHDGMKLWLKEHECQTFTETEAFPIQAYHICNVCFVDKCCMFSYLKCGENVKNAFEEAMVSSVHRSCEFR